MRLLYLEIKRVFKTRLTWVLLLAAVLLSAFMAYIPVTFVKSLYIDEGGRAEVISGIKAIENNKKLEEKMAGDVTEEKIEQAILNVQECYREYGSYSPKELPPEVYNEKIAPISFMLNGASILLTGQSTYYDTLTDTNISAEDASEFYEKYEELLRLQDSDKEVQKQIMKTAGEIKVPFRYEPGFSLESFDYMTLYLLLLMFIAAVITAPVFSAEYQTGADSILRCTRYGRLRLALTKICSALLLCGGVIVLGLAAFLMITNCAFGLEGLKTSVQMMGSVLKIPQITVGQAQIIVAGAGFLSLTATICFTLFLSAKCKNIQMSTILAVGLGLLPMIIYMASSSNIMEIIRCILPSGGLGMMNSFTYELLGHKFLNIGALRIWSPYLIAGAALIEIPVFIALAARAYCKHEGE